MIIPRPIADWLVTTTQGEPGLDEPPERLDAPGQEADEGGVGQVVDVLDHGAVAVEEDRRPLLARRADRQPGGVRRAFSSASGVPMSRW